MLPSWSCTGPGRKARRWRRGGSRYRDDTMAEQHIASETADRLRRMILDGSLPGGTQLPAERMLCAQLGISRTALRDALQALEATGLIETRGRSGRFVTVAFSPDRSTAAARTWLNTHRADVVALNEVRQLLEPRAVQTIPAARVRPVAEAAGQILASQADAVSRKDPAEAARLDAAFHLVLVAETPNLPLRVLTQELIDMASPHATAVYQSPRAAANSLAQHADIVQAVTGRDLALAARLLRNHARTAYRQALITDDGNQMERPPLVTPKGQPGS